MRPSFVLGSAIRSFALGALSLALAVTPQLSTVASAELSKPFWTEGELGDASARPDSLADLAEKVSPAVVNIRTETTRRAQDLSDFFGGPGGQNQEDRAT